MTAIQGICAKVKVLSTLEVGTNSSISSITDALGHIIYQLMQNRVCGYLPYYIGKMKHNDTPIKILPTEH